MRTLKQHEMDKHDINLNTGQVKFSNSIMGIFEDLKTNKVDPEVEALEPDVMSSILLVKHFTCIAPIHSVTGMSLCGCEINLTCSHN